MAMNDSLNRGQPDACAGKFLYGVQSLERAEQFADVRHIESGSIVTHKKRWRSLQRAHAELDPGAVYRLTPESPSD